MIHWKKWTNCLGTMTYSNKDKYVGEWEDGFKHGKGTMIFLDETVKKGIWEFDKLVE